MSNTLRDPVVSYQVRRISGEKTHRFTDRIYAWGRRANALPGWQDRTSRAPLIIRCPGQKPTTMGGGTESVSIFNHFTRMDPGVRQTIAELHVPADYYVGNGWRWWANPLSWRNPYSRPPLYRDVFPTPAGEDFRAAMRAIPRNPYAPTPWKTTLFLDACGPGEASQFLREAQTLASEVGLEITIGAEPFSSSPEGVPEENARRPRIASFRKTARDIAGGCTLPADWPDATRPHILVDLQDLRERTLMWDLWASPAQCARNLRQAGFCLTLMSSEEEDIKRMMRSFLVAYLDEADPGDILIP